MARPSKTAQEFIQSSFSPIVAVLCNAKVDSILSKNNLSFAELLQPFAVLEGEGHLREPNGSVSTVKNLKLTIRDVNWKPLPPTEARRQLNNAVLYNYNDLKTCFTLDGRKYNIPQATPWFEAWRETYLEVQFPSDHEFTKHFLSCMLVVTTHDENVIDAFNALSQQLAQLQAVTPPKLPKWFSSNILRSFVLLHDVSSVPNEKAEAIFETMKQHLDPNNCFLLPINSRGPSDAMLPTDPWAPYIRKYSENSESQSASTNAPTTPMEPRAGLFPSSANVAETACQIEPPHPLTNIETDMYDNANSLLSHSLSGSAESVCAGRAAADPGEAGDPGDPCEPHGAALAARDLDRMRRLVHDYCVKALLPYVEKQIASLSELVVNRKGVSRSLLSATKRWFGSGKAGPAGSSVIYSSDCPELQLRRLGDLHLLTGQWARAFDAYHAAKREFSADGAWLCYAGALEMAALAAAAAGDANKKTHAYMEEAIVTYLNTCRMPQYAVRATLLSAACLTGAAAGGAGGAAEAARQLLRMTSEHSDLRSAVLLEQAALCQLGAATASGTAAAAGSVGAVRPQPRKYAFHMVLAGHRYCKAGQKKHAYRCYMQAYEVYGASGWRLATEHVQASLGRLAGALRLGAAAARWLAGPLAPGSPHPPRHHRAALRDYLAAHLWMETGCGAEAGEVPTLPLPLLAPARTAVLCVGPAPLSAPGRAPASAEAFTQPAPAEDRYWHKLEQMLLQRAEGGVPLLFRPQVGLHTPATDAAPHVPQGEPIQISITLRNPLKILVLLKDVELLWCFTPATEAGGAETPAAPPQTPAAPPVAGQRLPVVWLQAEKEEQLCFSLTPVHVGQLSVYAVAFKLVSLSEDNQETGSSLTVAGKVELRGAGAGALRCLDITVGPSAPCLQMTFSETAAEAVSGELRCVQVEFRNVGPAPLAALHLAVSHPDAARLAAPPGGAAGAGGEGEGELFQELLDEKFAEAPTQLEERTARLTAWRRAAARHARAVLAGGAELAPGGVARAELWLRVRAAAPALQLLAYYRAAGPPPHRHRLLRHVFRFNVTEAVQVTATARQRLAGGGERLSLAVAARLGAGPGAGGRLRLLQASLLSRGWALAARAEPARDPRPLLEPRERVHLVLEAVRLGAAPRGLHASSIRLAGDAEAEPDVTAAPYSQFVLEYDAPYIEDEEAYLRRAPPAGSVQSMFVLRWELRLEGRAARGQHCVWLDAGGAGGGVRLSVAHAERVAHDFAARRVCVVPVAVTLVNCHDEAVEAVVEMTTKRADAEETVQSAGAGWAGRAGGAWRVALPPHEPRTLHTQAALARPGAYVLAAAAAAADAATLLVVQQA